MGWPQRRILSKRKHAVKAELFESHSAHRRFRLTVWTVSHKEILGRRDLNAKTWLSLVRNAVQRLIDSDRSNELEGCALPVAVSLLSTRTEHVENVSGSADREGTFDFAVLLSVAKTHRVENQLSKR